MKTLLYIGIGGGLGSVARYLLAGWVQQLCASKAGFPFGTLAVNIAGCFIIGLLGGWADTFEMFTPLMRMFLFIGFLGGFTTFSTFGYETYAFVRDGQLLFALANIVSQIIIGLGAVWAGYMLSTIRG